MVKTKEPEQINCDICGNPIPNKFGNWPWGNNADPVVPNGRCCDECNEDAVIPARRAQLFPRENGVVLQ